MIVHHDINRFKVKYPVVTIGIFDGVHLGHREVIRNAVENAEKMGISSAVVTFLHHPRLVIAGSAPGMITSVEEKIKIFKELGVDSTVIIDFNEKFVFKGSDLGKGKHKILAEAFASWQKHDFTEPGNIKNNSREIEITIN